MTHRDKSRLLGVTLLADGHHNGRWRVRNS
jgi:hypothetical protein